MLERDHSFRSRRKAIQISIIEDTLIYSMAHRVQPFQVKIEYWALCTPVHPLPLHHQIEKDFRLSNHRARRLCTALRCRPRCQMSLQAKPTCARSSILQIRAGGTSEPYLAHRCEGRRFMSHLRERGMDSTRSVAVWDIRASRLSYVRMRKGKIGKVTYLELYITPP